MSTEETTHMMSYFRRPITNKRPEREPISLFQVYQMVRTNRYRLETMALRAIADELISRGANIAESYDDYLQLGFALAHGLGEAGGEIYHRLCAQSAKYREGECEKKWQECLRKNDGRTTIASFYKMAQQAGVDLSAISRQYPSAEKTSKPQKPQCCEENNNKQGKECIDDSQNINNQTINTNYKRPNATSANSTYSGEETEVLRFSFSRTFSQDIDKDKLPVIMQRCLEGKGSAEEQDLFSFGGRGIIFSTEADTLTQALSQEWGQFTDILRMAFHHETITSSRTKDKQHIVIDEPQLGLLVTCTPQQITYLLPPKQNENGSSSRDLFYCTKGNLGWRNPFSSKEPIADRYREIGQAIKQMYDLLVDRNKNRIQILLTEEQQQAFNTHFEPLLPEQIGLYGVDFAAFVVRIALVAFRMMMVLTTLRNFEQGHLADTQQQAFVCTDDDYQTAMTIIDCLVVHTAYVYNTLLHPSDDPQLSVQPLKAREQQLFTTLSDDFTTKQFEDTAKSLSIPLKTAQRYLGNLISRYQLVNRTSQGHYVKTKR